MLSMTRPSQVHVSSSLVGLGVAAVAGCGNDVPTGAVAKVGDTTITQDSSTSG